MMRTTLTIDDDVAILIEKRRRREGLSLQQVINALLREGLRSGRQAPRARFLTRPHSLAMRAGFDPARLNQLVDELETDVHREREARAPKMMLPDVNRLVYAVDATGSQE